MTVGLATACAGDNGPPLSELGESGRDIARDRGCGSCHGRNGGGGIGPAWRGLYGTTVVTEAGESLRADEEYLRRAIAEPTAEIVSGYTLVMPDNNLDDGEIAAVVAYIRELG